MSPRGKHFSGHAWGYGDVDGVSPRVVYGQLAKRNDVHFWNPLWQSHGHGRSQAFGKFSLGGQLQFIDFSFRVSPNPQASPRSAPSSRTPSPAAPSLFRAAPDPRPTRPDP